MKHILRQFGGYSYLGISMSTLAFMLLILLIFRLVSFVIGSKFSFILVIMLSVVLSIITSTQYDLLKREVN